jgi:hypothetical protein
MQELVDAADTLKRGRPGKRPVNSRRTYYELVSRYADRLDQRRADLALDAAVAAFAGRKADLDKSMKAQETTAKHAAFLGPAQVKGENAVLEQAAARKAAAEDLAKVAEAVVAGDASQARKLPELRAAAKAATEAKAEYKFHVRVAPPRK